MAELATFPAELMPERGGLAALGHGPERIAVANVDGTLWAFDDACTHRQCSLAEGVLEGSVVTCPCHGSRYDVTTGERLRGPAVRPVRVYRLRHQSTFVQVEE